MNKLKTVVRAMSPFRGGKRSSDYDLDQAGSNLYEEAMWARHVDGLNVRSFMELFYNKYNPQKKHTIDFILEQFAGRENDMLLMLSDKYQISREDMYSLMDRAGKLPLPRAGAPKPPPPSRPSTHQQPPAPPSSENSPMRQNSVESSSIRTENAREHSVGQRCSLNAGKDDLPRRSSVSDFVSGLSSLQDADKARNSTRSRPSIVTSVSQPESLGGRPQQASAAHASRGGLSRPTSHRAVNQSLKGVILEVRNSNTRKSPQTRYESPASAQAKTQKSDSRSLAPEAQNQARLRAILDDGSDDINPTQRRPFVRTMEAPGIEEYDSSSGGEESGIENNETDEEVLMNNNDYKYSYPNSESSRGHQGLVQKSLQKTPSKVEHSHEHPHFGTKHQYEERHNNFRKHPMNDQAANEKTPQKVSESLSELENARVLMSDKNCDKNEMMKLLEKMVANPTNMSGVISEFVKSHEEGSRKCNREGFVLGHHSRFDEPPADPDCISSVHDQRSHDMHPQPKDSPGGNSHVLNLSDLHSHHRSLEKDIASLATSQIGRNSDTQSQRSSRTGGTSSPYMNATTASTRRSLDTARQAKSSGTFVPYRDPTTPALNITRARSPAPGVSRSNWTGVTPSEEDLLKLRKRSTSSSSIHRGRAGGGLGYDGSSTASWGERPRTVRAASPSSYDVRRNNPRAASPTPSVRSIDSFGSNGSLNARNVANRYRSPSPSVQSDYTARYYVHYSVC